MSTANIIPARLTGVIAFPVTPFTPVGGLDLAGLERNLEALMRHGWAAIVAAGGTGELYSLTPDEHREVVKMVVKQAAGRAPVVVGVGFNAALGAQMARQAAEAGADAILALPPYYPQADDEGLLEYYAALGAATPLPLWIYSRDWVNPEADWVLRLAERVPTLRAWKDGQADLRRLQRIMHRMGDRLQWIGGAGDDAVPGYYALGIRVFTSSISTVAPRLALKLHELAAQGEQAELHKLLHEFVTPLYGLRARRRGYEVTVMKAMMQEAGLAAGPVRPPLPTLRASERAEVAALVKHWQAWL